MAATDTNTPAQDPNRGTYEDDTKTNPNDIDHAERVLSVEEADFSRNHQDYSNVDQELAKYVSEARIAISPEKNAELRRKIDKRILVVMVCTYFLQAIDKGTLSFASIMGIIGDTHLVGQEYSWLTTCIYITILVVEYPQNWIIARYVLPYITSTDAGALLSTCLVLTTTSNPQSAPWQVSQLLHHRLGHRPRLHRSLHQFRRPRHRPHPAWSLRVSLPAVVRPPLVHLVPPRGAGC